MEHMDQKDTATVTGIDMVTVMVTDTTKKIKKRPGGNLNGYSRKDNILYKNDTYLLMLMHHLK
jgi:hypothetical protein